MPARTTAKPQPSPLPWALKGALPLAALFLMIPALARAHPGGHAEGAFATGIAHPLGGLDHVLAMMAVGLLAAITGGRAVWAFPLAFVAAMLAGGLMGWAGVSFPGVEPMILTSIIVLGATLALAVRLPLVPMLALITIFGVAHGHAHGAEGPAAGIALYAAGFALATAALHLAGIGLGAVMQQVSAMLPRLVGGGTVLAGLALAMG